MDFRTDKSQPISSELATSRYCGVFDNGLILNFDEPLTDEKIKSIRAQNELIKFHESEVKRYKEMKNSQALEKQNEKEIEEKITKALEDAFKDLTT